MLYDENAQIDEKCCNSKCKGNKVSAKKMMYLPLIGQLALLVSDKETFKLLKSPKKNEKRPNVLYGVLMEHLAKNCRKFTAKKGQIGHRPWSIRWWLPSLQKWPAHILILHKDQTIKDFSWYSPPLELAWATVVAKGLKKKAATPHRSFRSRSDQIKQVPEILHEDPDLATQSVVRKAASIVQQAFTPGTVVFSFPEDLFSSRQATYYAIQGQIGALKGVKRLSMYIYFC